MAMKIQAAVLWVATSCSDIEGYHCFGGPCNLHLQGEVSGTRKWKLIEKRSIRRGRVLASNMVPVLLFMVLIFSLNELISSA
jgi:hypothetical protein